MINTSKVSRCYDHAVCYPFKNLKRIFPSNSKTTSPVLLFKTTSRQRDCVLSSVTTDGSAGHGRTGLPCS